MVLHMLFPPLSAGQMQGDWRFWDGKALLPESLLERVPLLTYLVMEPGQETNH